MFSKYLPYFVYFITKCLLPVLSEPLFNSSPASCKFFIFVSIIVLMSSCKVTVTGLKMLEPAVSHRRGEWLPGHRTGSLQFLIRQLHSSPDDLYIFDVDPNAY